MLTHDEILKALLVPAIVSALIGAVGCWRRWAWAMPLALGAGFVLGYWLMRAPAWNPSDGSERLYWLAMPVTLLAMLHRWTRGWTVLLAGAVALVLMQPLYPRHATVSHLWGLSWALAGAGALHWFATRFAEARLGAGWIVAAWAVVLEGAGVLVMSSNFRAMGLTGMTAAAATAPLVMLIGRAGGARAVVAVAFPLLVGVLINGRFYADPGITWVQLGVLMGAPLVVAAGALVPVKRRWVRGVAALLAVMILVGAIVGPAALAAKKAAENPDPYAGYYR